MRKIFYSIFILGFLLASCKSLQKAETGKNIIRSQYQHSIIDAMTPDSAKIYETLLELNKENPYLQWKSMDGKDYILMLSWVQNISYFEPFIDSAFYNTGNYPIWVTASPELLLRMKNERCVDKDMRLRQLLGLPPNAIYNYFVEFWVKPEDLFRPCPDKEITDNKCDLCFPAQTDSAHIAWINTNRIDLYYQCDLYQKYPWTQLGYTYDWNSQNHSHVGLSEFVIGTNKTIKVKAIYKTADYLKKNIGE